MHALTLTVILASTALAWLAVLHLREARAGDGIEGEHLHIPTPWIVRLWRRLRTPSTVDCGQCQRDPSGDRCGRCRA